MIGKSSQFLPFKFGDVQLRDTLNIHVESTSLDSFLKAYKTSETKSCFPYEWFDEPENLNNTELRPYEAIFSRLRYNTPLEKDYSVFQISLDGGLTSKEGLSKLKLKQPHATGQESTYTFKDFLRWYNNNDVVPTLEAMQKLVELYHNREIDKVKL